VTTLHAEAYPSGEFRHGPLSMIDETEKTPGNFNQYKLDFSFIHCFG
jgi:glucosamine 6-phosphate synthetase-like amidotransferase/phosphosugar isomerase protein